MKIKANAKINLTLDITGKREDGYHLIDSVFQSISLYDEITVEKSEDLSVICTDSDICAESNTAYIAAQRFFEHTGICGGAKIFIKKNIPLVSGMGGGSADAAAVISALNKIYKTELDIDTLCKIGLSVGADVPFCLVGGTIRVEGIGEKLKKLPDMPDCNMLIIKHGKKQSTADMYKKIDSHNNLTSTTPDIIDAIKCGNLSRICKNISNAFSTVCNNSCLIEDIKATNPLTTSLSGSGPTVFAIYDNMSDMQNAKKMLENQGYAPIVVSMVNSGLIFE